MSRGLLRFHRDGTLLDEPGNPFDLESPDPA
jgi:hypothetical protein